MTSPLEPNPIVHAFNGLLANSALVAAFELDLFTRLWPEPRALAEILETMSLPKRSGEVLLEACRAIGLLERVDGGYRTPEALVPALVRSDSGDYQITRFMLESHRRDLVQELSDPLSFIRNDGHLPDLVMGNYQPGYSSSERARAFHAYMDISIRSIVEVMLEAYPLAGRRHVLDLFGGRGQGCRAMVARTPGLRGTFVDLPEVVAAAMQEGPGVEGWGADITQAELPTGCDVVTIMRTAHDLVDDLVALALRRAFSALPSGGAMIIAERMLGRPETDRELRLRDCSFLMVGPHIRFRTPEAYQAMLRDAGFSDVSVLVPTRAPHLFYRGLHLVIGHKP